jgi:hypothetical protein
MLKNEVNLSENHKNKPQPFCGLISCASCGMMITGEYKVKKQKMEMFTNILLSLFQKNKS